MEIQLHGWKEFQQKMRKMPKHLNSELTNAIKKSALLIEAESKPLTPVDTGRLRGSIKSDIKKLEAKIAPHVNYSVYVHQGTRYMKGRPFLKQGMEKAMPQIKRWFKNGISIALRK